MLNKGSYYLFFITPLSRFGWNQDSSSTLNFIILGILFGVYNSGKFTWKAAIAFRHRVLLF